MYLSFSAGLLSPQSSRTPPPSPAEFKETKRHSESETVPESTAEKEQATG